MAVAHDALAEGGFDQGVRFGTSVAANGEDLGRSNGQSFAWDRGS